MEHNWSGDIPVAITVSDKEGKIIFMNNSSAEVFAKYGGLGLIGSQLNNCHKPESQQIIAGMMADKSTNAYTIEKNGVKKMIYQCPWYSEGEIAGLVEFSFVLPAVLPHFIRS